MDNHEEASHILVEYLKSMGIPHPNDMTIEQLKEAVIFTVLVILAKHGPDEADTVVIAGTNLICEFEKTGNLITAIDALNSKHQ